jgi:hypothetical protein
VTPEAAARALRLTEEDPESPLGDLQPQVAGVVDVMVDERDVDGSDLSPMERQFCSLMIRGPKPENATECYQLLHPNANRDTCGQAGPLLARQPRIETYLRALRQRAIEGSNEDLVAELKNWIPVAVKAKRLLEAHVDGTRRLTGTDLSVCREILDRALGRAKETLEVGPTTRMDALIKELAARSPSRYVRREGSVGGRVEVGSTSDNGDLR